MIISLIIRKDAKEVSQSMVVCLNLIEGRFE
jgi:hypothetical protein